MKKRYNIMTSSDGNLIKQIEILMYSISVNLSDAEIDFYYFHRGLNQDKLDGLRTIEDKLENLTLIDIVVDDVESYDYIAKYGGGWAGEAYYSLCVHKYLPESVDRILYLDAGDVIVTDDISPFYDTDFEDNIILASNIRIYSEGKPVVFFDEADIKDENKILRILDSTFNSGSYMINVDKLRKSGLTIDDYVAFTDMFMPLAAVQDKIYFGDQGFLSACFLGDIKYWGYPECDNLISTAYNFMMGWYNVFDKGPSFKPAIVHFVGNVKPWQVRYAYELEWFKEKEKIKEIDELIPGQEKWYYLWQQYALCVEGMENK